MKDNKDLDNINERLDNIVEVFKKIKKEYETEDHLKEYYSNDSYYSEKFKLYQKPLSKHYNKYYEEIDDNYKDYYSEEKKNYYAKDSLEWHTYNLFGEKYHHLMREFPRFLQKEFNSEKCKSVILCLFGNDISYPVTISEATDELKAQMIKAPRSDFYYGNVCYIYDVVFGLVKDKKILQVEEINKKFAKFKEELSKL